MSLGSMSHVDFKKYVALLILGVKGHSHCVGEGLLILWSLLPGGLELICVGVLLDDQTHLINHIYYSNVLSRQTLCLSVFRLYSGRSEYNV